uniref:Uncharacterized protein n=1 Tax=Salix viminalis TaxID=40686 RepID=A0A6N2M571_SALVM
MKKEDRDFLRKSSESGLPVQASEVNGSGKASECILHTTIKNPMLHKKHTSTLFASCPHVAWPHYASDRTLTVVACKWLCSQAKALMSSASLHHRVPSLYLLKIEQGSPSRAYLRGFRKLEEQNVQTPNPNSSLISSSFRPFSPTHMLLWLSSSWCCCWNMVRDAGAVTWGTEATVAFVMRISAKQIGVLGLGGGRSGYPRNHISFIQSLQKAHFFFFLFFCFLGLW